MAQTSWPFENADTTEAQFSALFAKLQTTGVDGDSSGTSLAVSANTGMAVNVAAGFAIVRGFAYQSTAVEPLTLDAGNTQPRIDLVILRLDPTVNSVVLAVKKGTPAASPTDPALTQVEGAVWEMPLAKVTVGANATAVGPLDIADARPLLSTQVGRWTTANRPASPTAGLMGYNSTLGVYEFFNGLTWTSATIIADGSITDAKLAVPPRRYASTGYYLSTTKNIAPSDAGTLVQFNTATANVTVNVTANCLVPGDRVDFIHEGTGVVTFAWSSPVVVASVADKKKLTARYSACTLICTGTDQFRLIGDLVA